MLRIHAVTSAAQAKVYYQVSDYYSEGQETVGRWGGRLAPLLGLQGRVTQEAFERLCDNRRPDGSPLTARTNEHRRVGYDLTFSAPKGFSLLEALAGDADRAELRHAFDRAVAETMAEHVEPDMRVRVRAKGADHDVVTGSMLWAEFDHSTSRPVAGSAPDPHRHRHVLAFNVTRGDDGRLKAGQFGDIKRDGEFYSAVFYSKLATRLEGLGYRVERRGGKEWGIAGVSRELEKTFSKRTGEVEAEHAERMASDPEYRPEDKYELGQKTRSRKQKELTQDQLRDAWAEQLNGGDREALAAVYGREVASDLEVTAGEAVTFAIAHLSERLSVFPERELMRVALLHGLGDVTPEEVRAELPRQGVLTAEIGGRMMATTAELQAEERFLLRLAEPGRGVVPVGVPEGFERGRLNEGQFNAVVGLLNSPSRVNVLVGPAGAGKSSLLSAYDQAMRAAGESVVYLATTAKAVEVLQGDGFEANTLARFLVDPAMQEAAKGCRVVVDESSMMGHADAVKLFKLLERIDLKLIAVGDPLQHGAVNRGAFLTLMHRHAGIEPFRLNQILRQQDADYRQAVKLLSEGQTLQGFDAIDGMGWVEEIADDAERAKLIAAEYRQALDNRESVLVVSPTHRESAQLAEAIRAELRDAGRITGKEREFTRLVPVSDVSEAERGLALTYADRAGEVLLFTQNAKGNITKGDRLTIGDPAAVPVSEASKFQIYRPERIALAAGDRIRFTGSVKLLGDDRKRLTNGMVRTVAGFDRSGNIKLAEGGTVAKDAGLFRHAFVETSFGSQGQTVDRVILGMAASSDCAMSQEQLYVSASRGKRSLTIFTDDKAAIREAVQRSSQKLVALDIRPAEQERATLRLRDRLYQRMRWLRSMDQARHAVTPQAIQQPERREDHGYGR